MKNFLKKILIFSIPILILWIAYFLYLNSAINYNFSNYKIKQNVYKLFVGDSHVEVAIDDNLIFNSKNIAQSSEGYIFTYAKISKITKNNPSIDTIILGVSYHNFSKYYDYYIFNQSNMEKYFFILSADEKIVFLKNTNKPFKYFINSIKSTFKPFKFYGWLGGYKIQSADIELNQNSIQKRIKNQYYKNQNFQEFSTVNEIYFCKIVEYCKNNGIVLIALNTPLYSGYENQIPNKFKRKFKNIVKENDINVIDFKNYNFEYTDFLPDGDHVSEEGAIKSSKIIDSLFRISNHD